MRRIKSRRCIKAAPELTAIHEDPLYGAGFGWRLIRRELIPRSPRVAWVMSYAGGNISQGHEAAVIQGMASLHPQRTILTRNTFLPPPPLPQQSVFVYFCIKNFHHDPLLC